MDRKTMEISITVIDIMCIIQLHVRVLRATLEL